MVLQGVKQTSQKSWKMGQDLHSVRCIIRSTSSLHFTRFSTMKGIEVVNKLSSRDEDILSQQTAPNSQETPLFSQPTCEEIPRFSRDVVCKAQNNKTISAMLDCMHSNALAEKPQQSPTQSIKIAGLEQETLFS